jgi:hypothetical protein
MSCCFGSLQVKRNLTYWTYWRSRQDTQCEVPPVLMPDSPLRHRCRFTNQTSTSLHLVCGAGTNRTIPWSGPLSSKLIVAQVVKKLPASMEFEGPLPCTQNHEGSPYPKPNESDPKPHILLLEDPYYYPRIHS